MGWETVLRFWFGPLDADGCAAPEQAALWFTRDAAFDANIRLRFGTLHEELMAGKYETWLATTRGRLAYIVVLDQFSRNLFRTDARAFAGDERARQAALEGLELGCDRELAFDERRFFYMPLMHAEDLAVQERSLGLYKAWRDQLVPSQRERLSSSLHYAQRHRDVVARFGRFPHRNHLIGRSSTGDEVAFIREAGGGRRDTLALVSYEKRRLRRPKCPTARMGECAPFEMRRGFGAPTSAGKSPRASSARAVGHFGLRGLQSSQVGALRVSLSR